MDIILSNVHVTMIAMTKESAVKTTLIFAMVSEVMSVQ